MKRLFLVSVASLVLAQAASGYVNQGVIQNPNFVIDDPLFVNGPGAQFLVYNDFLNIHTPYHTYNTLNYTNSGLMESLLGFEFDTRAGGRTRWANSFHNDTYGTVNSGTAISGFFSILDPLFQSYPTPLTIIGATNVVNRGSLSVASEGVLSIRGRTLDLSRGKLSLSAFEDSQDMLDPFGDFFGNYYDFGQYDGYWGVGDGRLNPAAQFGGTTGYTPLHGVTNRAYLPMMTSLSGSPHVSVVTDNAASNVVVNVAFINNSNLGEFTITPYAWGNNMYVEWSWTRKDPVTGAEAPAYLRLLDDIYSVSNIVLMTNGYGPPRTAFRPTYIPTNYTFYASSVSITNYLTGLMAMPPGAASGWFPNTNMTPEYSAYQLRIAPTTSLIEDYAGRCYTNMPGRMQLIAEGPGSSLNLQRARILGGNSLVLKATNHFAGAGGAKIVTPFGDLDLGTTNSSLSISNLLAPVVPRLNGSVNLWSTRFTNVDSRNYTYAYHVLFVESQLNPSVPPKMQNVTLRGQNIQISDVLNVLSNLTLRAENVTIVSNAPGVDNRAGQLNLLSGKVFAPDSAPGLLRLTNHGGIYCGNLMYFTNQTRPYAAFVNYGTVTNAGSIIAADTFWNSGVFQANGGVMSLRCQDATMRDGAWFARGSEMSVQGNSLFVSNHVLLTDRSLTLALTSCLDDGSLSNAVATVTNRNSWSVGDGLRLPVRPARASLLATTIANTAPAYAEIVNQWAGEDQGCTPQGYENNAALGHLILDGGTASTFQFNGSGASSALYVDLLELRGAAAQRDANGDFAGLGIASNMKIYYADARIGGISVAEKMNGKNGGRLCWVSAYAGFNTSTNLIYPDGTTNAVNIALAQSCNLDSDGDGLVNCSDPTPILRPQDIGLTVVFVPGAVTRALVSWRAAALSEYSLDRADSASSTNWQLLTNFIQGPVSGPITVADPIDGAASRFYRVRVGGSQP